MFKSKMVQVLVFSNLNWKIITKEKRKESLRLKINIYILN